jgi:uncharacterized membrane protein YphA (DoxX/SURF4 family)
VTVQRLFSIFPAGAPGAGLLVLRASVAATLIVEGASACAWFASAWAIAVVAGTVLFLLLGLLTPYAAVASCLLHLTALYCTGWEHGFHQGVSAVNSAVLAVLGPGAWSIDARVFGRRIVRLPPIRGRG